jgi:hypothetical protein
MKKIMLIWLVLLTSCAPIYSTILNNDPPSVKAFEVGEKCLHVCWLGIQPEITSANEAISILMASNQINHEALFKRSGTGLQTIWFTNGTKTVYSYVWLTFQDNLVKSIQFQQLVPFRMKHFLSIFGEPDAIIIDLDHTIDGGDLVNYAVYIPQYKVSLSVYPGSWDGPNPEDLVGPMTIDADFTYSFFLNGVKQQPWLGYGHLKDYLLGQELPSGPYTPPETGF